MEGRSGTDRPRHELATGSYRRPDHDSSEETMNGYELDLWKLIHQGALATYPLILLSILGFTVILERLWAMRNVMRTTAELAVAVGRPLATA